MQITHQHDILYWLCPVKQWSQSCPQIVPPLRQSLKGPSIYLSSVHCSPLLKWCNLLDFLWRSVQTYAHSKLSKGNSPAMERENSRPPFLSRLRWIRRPVESASLCWGGSGLLFPLWPIQRRMHHRQFRRPRRKNWKTGWTPSKCWTNEHGSWGHASNTRSRARPRRFCTIRRGVRGPALPELLVNSHRNNGMQWLQLEQA